jgi:SPP1 family predicted phage head-tail adaptor
MTIRAGRLRHIVSHQQLTAGSPQQSASGEPSEEWVDVETGVFAGIEPLQGRELFVAQEMHSEVTVRIRERYRPGVTAAQRVVFGTRIYNIEYIIDFEEKHVELHLMCSEGLNAG